MENFGHFISLGYLNYIFDMRIFWAVKLQSLQKQKNEKSETFSCK